MPLHVFVCSRCSTRFEELVRESERVACPECGHAKVERQLSTFAVRGERARSIGRDLPERSDDSPGACGSCGDPRGPGACNLDG